jgi:hypothetical protein
MHGQLTLGNQAAWANRLAREAVSSFWNQLQYCCFDLSIDINDLLQSISFKDKNGQSAFCKALPYHPINDAEKIAHWRGMYQWHRMECALLHLHITKEQYFKQRNQAQQKQKDISALAAFQPTERRSLRSVHDKDSHQGHPTSAVIVKEIIQRIEVNGKVGNHSTI